MANSVNPDQTAPKGAVCSGSTLFAFILKFDSNVWQLFAADDFSRQHFQMHFCWWFKVVRDSCQKITLLLLKSKSVRVVVPESCF